MCNVDAPFWIEISLMVDWRLGHSSLAIVHRSLARWRRKSFWAGSEMKNYIFTWCRSQSSRRRKTIRIHWVDRINHNVGQSEGFPVDSLACQRKCNVIPMVFACISMRQMGRVIHQRCWWTLIWWFADSFSECWRNEVTIANDWLAIGNRFPLTGCSQSNEKSHSTIRLH